MTARLKEAFAHPPALGEPAEKILSLLFSKLAGFEVSERWAGAKKS
jgi:hypothetical protein